MLFPHRARRNSEGPQQDRANKNERSAYRKHIELHRDVHASHLHHSCANQKSSRKRRLSEARRLLQRRRILCRTHFSAWLCQHHEICKQFRANKKVPHTNNKIYAQAPRFNMTVMRQIFASKTRAKHNQTLPPSIKATMRSAALRTNGDATQAVIAVTGQPTRKAESQRRTKPARGPIFG
jgi:hypothetical protein